MLEDKEVRFFIFVGVCVFLLLLLFIVFFIVYYYKRQVAFVKERESLSSKYQQEILNTQLEIREQTLKNISQEIHDNIGQTLSLVKLNLNTMDPGKPDALQKKMFASKDLVAKAINDLRHLSRSLNTDSILSAGLIKAVDNELSLIRNVGVFDTKLEIIGPPMHVDPKKELILFRIVQEAVNNIIKHSGASYIIIRAEFTGAFLKISISDNGKGFDENGSNSEGAGLRNMNSRAQLIGGNFELRTNPEGTIVLITVPIIET